MNELLQIVEVAKSRGIYVDHSLARGVIVRFERDLGMPELIRIRTLVEFRTLIGEE